MERLGKRFGCEVIKDWIQIEKKYARNGKWIEQNIQNVGIDRKFSEEIRNIV